MNNRIAWDVMSLLCPVIAAANSDEVTSAAADFRTLALSVHNPAERLAAATQLFRAHGET